MSTSSTVSKTNFYVDVHAHVFPDFYADSLREAGINDIDGWKSPEWSVEATLAAMDEYNIKTQVLSMSSPGIDFLQGEKASKMARRLNDFMAQLAKEHSPRFGSLAILPLPDIEASLAEIAYACDTLGVDGFGLTSNYHGIYLGEPALDPIFAELNKRRAVVFVHPTVPPHWKTFTIGIPAPVMEYVFDSTRMAQNLVHNGVKAKYPDMTIIVAHGGGTLPFTKQRVVKFLMRGKNDLFDTFAYELTATTEPEQIRAIMSIADPKLCLMGFDNPFMKPDWWGPLQNTLEAYDFEQPGLLQAIQNGNALRLFPKVKDRLAGAGQLT